MARFASGWVKFYRETVDGDIGQRPFLLGLFVKLLLWANWKPSDAMFMGERIKLQPGQLLTGLRDLSPDVEEDPYLHRVRNALEYLEKRGTITQATSNRGRLITICNWSEYQVSEDVERNSIAIQTQTESNLSANAPQLSKEGKKERKKETNTPLPPKGLQAIWNEHCGNLPKAESLNPDRERQAKARTRENGDPAYWVGIVRAIAANPFCRGTNDRGWVANFDYLLRPRTHVQISERLKAGPPGARPVDDSYEREYAAAVKLAEDDARAKGIL